MYLRTSPHLTSLSRVGKRAIGEQGGAGAGGYKNGKRGADVVIDVPVGTVVRELRREGVEVAWARQDREEGVGVDAGVDEDVDVQAQVQDAEQRRRRRRERFFILHPNATAREEEMRHAEDILRREGFFRRTPTAEQQPLMHLDISSPLSSPLLLAAGGRGGLGNPHFQLPHRPSARIASRGLQPPTQTFSLELKLLADVGLVGLPNAGKSTLLRKMTNRKAEVAGYAFTTLNPQVGVVRVYDDGTWTGAEGVVRESEEERGEAERKRREGEYEMTPKEAAAAAAAAAATSGQTELSAPYDSPLTSSSSSSSPSPSAPPPTLALAPATRTSTRTHDRLETTRFTISDNPGLLPRASENVGLGHSFLRSIERSLALVLVVDLSRPDPAGDVRALRYELEAYKPGLAGRAVAVVLNKADEVDEGEGRGRVEAVRREVAGVDVGVGVGAKAGAEGLEVGEGMEGGEQNEVAQGGREGQGGNECEVLVMSGKYGLGVERLVRLLAGTVERRRAELAAESIAEDGQTGTVHY